MVNSMNTIVISCCNDMTMVYNDMTIVFNYAYHDITTKTIGVSNFFPMQRGKKTPGTHAGGKPISELWQGHSEHLGFS